MTKTIHQLIPDIYQLMNTKDGWFTPELAKSFSENVARRLQIHFNEYKGSPTLRLSKMGPQCPCALWHSIHHPELAEPLQPWAMLKYSYGHILEAEAITLAKATGHSVVGEQDELVVDGIVGHRDCVINGCIVDFKSANSWSFKTYQKGTPEDIDTFGSLSQLDGYLVGSLLDPLVTVKDKAYIVAIDKVLGKLHLYEHRIREDLIRKRIEKHKGIVSLSKAPHCECRTTAMGRSGNVKLDGPAATYNNFKYCCFPELRTFIYSGEKPVYLTHVARVPQDVLEIDKSGKPVYS